MRTAPVLLYTTFGSMTVAIIAELTGLLPAIAPTASEDLRILGGSLVVFVSIMFGLYWTTITFLASGGLDGRDDP